MSLTPEPASLGGGGGTRIPLPRCSVPGLRLRVPALLQPQPCSLRTGGEGVCALGTPMSYSFFEGVAAPRGTPAQPHPLGTQGGDPNPIGGREGYSAGRSSPPNPCRPPGLQLAELLNGHLDSPLLSAEVLIRAPPPHPQKWGSQEVKINGAGNFPLLTSRRLRGSRAI